MKTPLTAAFYGVSKSGKTTLAATFPNPVFISPAAERGWADLPRHPNWQNVTILTVPPVPGFDEIGPTARPSQQVPRLEPTQAMEQYILPKLWEGYQQRGWKTVVFDTASIYADMVVSEMTAYGSVVMTTRGSDNDWIKVQQHFLNIRNHLQGLPLNVVWLLHVKESEMAGKLVPAFTGSSLNKHILPTCGVVGYLEKRVHAYDKDGRLCTESTQVPTSYRNVRYLWTTCPPNSTPQFEVGTRHEALLPPYLPCGCEVCNQYGASYQALAHHLREVLVEA